MKIDCYKEKYRKINETNSKVIWMLLSLILVVLAGLRYFYRLDAREAFAVDESMTFATAVGYLKTGTPYEWDFWNDRISDMEYGGIVPYLKLLAFWMKFFGISLLSARSLSAILGCLFILSCIYIIRKMFQRVDITVVAVSFIILNPEITYLFRFIRMYCLVMLLAIWFLYFSFMALTRGNIFKGDNKAIRFIKRNLDFNFLYVGISIVICYISTKVHNIQMVMCGGMALFIFYKAIYGKEKKYINITCLGCICVLVGLIGVVFSRVLDLFPVIWYFINSLRFWVSIGTQNNSMYFWDSVNAVSNQVLMILGWGMAVASIFDKEQEKDRDQLVYLVFIQVISIVFFVWFANNYYATRYLCFILPISIIIFSYGFVRFIGKFWKRDVVLAFLICIVMIRGFKNGFDYIYTLWDAPASQKVYERIKERYGDDEVNILGLDLDMGNDGQGGYGYYCSKYLKSVNYIHWTSYNTEMPFSDVAEYAKQYPDGLVWVIERFMFSSTEDEKKFLQNWIDKVAGKGIDNYNISVGQLDCISPSKNEKGIFKEPFVLKTIKNDNILTIKLNTEVLDSDVFMICLKFTGKNLEDQVEKNYQLLTNKENHGDILTYEIDLYDIPEMELSNEIAIIADGALREEYIETE